MAILPVPENSPKGKKGQFAAEYKQPQNLMAGPQGYINAEPIIGVRRTMALDNGARVATQVEVDKGVYSRPPVSPVEYSFGNIKKSTQLTGVAGYNQREIPITESPDDMNQQEYMLSVAQEIDPKARMALKKSTAVGQQFFLNTPSMGTVLDYPIESHQMADNLLATAQQMKAKRTSDTLMASYSTTPDDVA